MLTHVNVQKRETRDSFGLEVLMSFAKPRTRRRQKPPPDALPAFTGLVNVGDVPQHRQPYGTGGVVVHPEPLVFGPGGPYVQPAPPRRIHSPRPFPEEGNTFFDNAWVTPGPNPGPNPGTSSHANFRKKERQWAKWREKVIPSLVQPYLRLLRETDSLRNMAGSSPPPACMCGGEDARSLEVARVSFQSTLSSSFLATSHTNNIHDIQV
jgi:hypothetical protein